MSDLAKHGYKAPHGTDLHVLYFAAPIRVGARVSITFLRARSRFAGQGSIFGESNKEQRYTPVIKDLETGIEYSSSDNFFLRGIGSVAELVPNEEREVSRTIGGIVERCIMLRHALRKDQQVVTLLAVRPEVDAQGFR